MSKNGRARRAAPYMLVGAAGCYLYYVAAHIEYSARAGTLGPDVWPKLVLGLIVAVCAWEVARIFVLRTDRQIEGVLGRLVEEAPADASCEAVATPRPWLLAGGIALTAAYVALVQPLGFFCATVPYIAAFIALGGYRRWGVTAIVSLAGTLAMLFFFMKVVYVSLPLGQGPFREVTLWLMQLFGIR